jgi:hypothetical protein
MSSSPCLRGRKIARAFYAGVLGIPEVPKPAERGAVRPATR